MENEKMILHIEDRESFADLVRLILGSASLVTVRSFAQAKALLESGALAKFDIVISDGDLGDGTGEEIIRLIKETGLSPIVFGLSGGPTPWADEGRSYNKNDFSGNEFKKAVDEALSQN